MAAQAGGDSAGIGTRLRAARERKGLTVLQAAEKMHVDARTLESLEAEDFAALGAPVYARGHLQHYADLVGESSAQLQELYSNATRAAAKQPDLTRIPRGEPDGDSRKLVGPTIIVLVAIALTGTVWWLLSLSNGQVQPTPVQERMESNTAEISAASATSATSNSDTTDAAAASAAGVAPAASLDASTSAPRSKDAELTLKFSADSWVEVYDASGQRLFYDVGAATSAHTVKGPAPLRIVLGNPSGVALEFNGRPAAVPNNVLPDGSVKFVINAHGRVVLSEVGH